MTSDQGRIVTIPAVDGQDPLVRSYLEANRVTCAWRTIAWGWVVVGLFAGVIGAVLGGVTAVETIGVPVDLDDGQSPLVRSVNRWLGHPFFSLAGMAVAGVLASTAGSLLRSRGVPAGQEPWWGVGLVALSYLLLYDPLACLGVVVGGISLVYAVAILFRLAALLLGGGAGLRASELPEPEGGWPVFTVLVPMYREREVAKNILVNLAAMDYPQDKLDVKFMLEADDPDTLPALQAAGIPAWAEAIVVPPGQPKTKPRACNHGLGTARGEFLVIFDAEDRPEPDQLKQAVLAFRRCAPRVVCLQARLAYHNHAQNLLTRWFALEYNVWFRRYLGGLERMGVPIPLGGTSNHFRTQELRGLGGWDPFNVTEDCDLGMRLHLAGMRTRCLDSTTWEEANSRVGNWLRQRSRWLKGYMITHLVWGRRPWWLLRRLGPWPMLGFLLAVPAVPILAAFNLILWAIASVHAVLIAIDLSRGFGLYEILATRDHFHQRVSWQVWFQGPREQATLAALSQVFAVAALVLLAGNLLFVLITVIFGRRPDQRGLGLAALLSPLYWVLIALAGWKGLWQLIVKPHYWEKTLHGLDQH